MKRKVIKFLSVLVSIILLMCVVPFADFTGLNLSLLVKAEELNEYIEGDYIYTITDNSVTIISYIGEETDVVVPSELGGFPVIGIGDGAFYSEFNIINITIPNSVRYIEDRAFCMCAGIVSINLPGSLISIGEEAFEQCSNLKSVIIPDNVLSIGHSAFGYCYELETALIGSGTTSIGKYIFNSCYKLREITVSENNELYCSDEEGVLFNKDKSVLIQFPAGNTVSVYEIPNGVETIDWYAFANCKNMKKVIIPDSVKNVLNWAFYDSCVTELIIGKCVENIEEGALSYNDSLISIKVDVENPYFCSDEAGVLFNKDKTKLIKYPGGNIRKEYSIPQNVKSIEDMAFSYSMNLENIIIPNTVEKIGSAAFRDCYNLKNLVIPNSVKEIETLAISYCPEITEVTLGNGLEYIGDWMFWDCYKLTDIYYMGSEKEWKEIQGGFSTNKMHFLSSVQEEVIEVVLNYKDVYVIENFKAESFESEDTSVAQINEEGKIIATGRGNTKVVVTDAVGNVVYYDIMVSYSWWQWIIYIVLFGWIWY